MLKQYFKRDSLDAEGEGIAAEMVAAAVLEEDSDDPLEINLPCDKEETVEDVHINPELDTRQKDTLVKMLHEFGDIFSIKPGCTNIAEHPIILTDSNPVRCKSYPIPHALRDCMKDEVEKMLELYIIEESNSPYSSQLLMVRKKDGTNHPVVDYRRLNRITVFDAEPMPVAEDIYARLAKAKYISKMDFVKGYWQIPMVAEDKQKTAFSTPFGLYQFKRMPFGLQNAGATYRRMMRKVLHGLQASDNFVDNVLSFTSEWDNHLAELKQVFTRVRNARLTVKPSECYFGYSEVEFLGHLVGNGQLTTTADKTECIANASRPQTKRQLRALLGLTSVLHDTTVFCTGVCYDYGAIDRSHKEQISK